MGIDSGAEVKGSTSGGFDTTHPAESMSVASRSPNLVRVHPLASLNPYQGNWTIKVRLTSKGPMRRYNNARGEGCVFSVELTNDDGTQIQATMFNDGARKFIDVFELGKVYYISKGSLKVANKQFTTVHNDFEMTLNEHSRVEEAVDEPPFIPETKFSFVPLDQLRPYLQQKGLIDVIGVVQHVFSSMSIRRKVDNEAVPKRDNTIVNATMKSVVVSLWGPLATGIGETLLNMSDASPIVAIKSLRVSEFGVSEFGGVSLSTVSKTIIQINPVILKSEKLKTWYASEGGTASFEYVGSGSSPMFKNNAPSMYSDRVTFEYITSNPCLGDEKPVYYTTRACISFINSDQTMYYRACNACNKKVTGEDGSGYSCQSCKKTQVDYTLRYIVSAKFFDATGGAWISAFGDEAEKLIGCSATELHNSKSKDDGIAYQTQLKKATWVPHILRFMVAPKEYKNEKRQRIIMKIVAPVDYAAESKFLLDEITSVQP